VKLEYVTIQKRGVIGIVRFDRKTNLNAFNEKLVIELTYAARTFFRRSRNPHLASTRHGEVARLPELLRRQQPTIFD